MSTFDIIMENCPFLKELIQDKITEEVSKKDVEILALQEALTISEVRTGDCENAINMIMEVM